LSYEGFTYYRIKEKFRFILKATYQHGRNLAFFVTIYKTLMVVQRRAWGQEKGFHAFFAGLIGGYIVFGKNNNINQQVNISFPFLCFPRLLFSIFLFLSCQYVNNDS